LLQAVWSCLRLFVNQLRKENRAQHPARLVGTDIYEIFSLSLRIFYAHPAMLRLPPLLS
jgi:hypothetical protein